MVNKAKTALLCAYTLARAKQFSEAEALILSHDELSKTPEAIDLLARIRMEEGDIAEARRLWQGVQSIYPEHQPSRLALKAMGRRQVKIKWTQVLAYLMPVVLILGFGIGVLFAKSATAPAPAEPQMARVQWDRIPTQAKLDALKMYQGKVRRVLVTSEFFARPETQFARNVVTQAMAQNLAISESAVYYGAATEEQGPDEIHLELELL